MNEFQKEVEAFRHHYKIKYNVELDDVTIYFFIRVNEMHKDLKKDIAKMPKLGFMPKEDYFLYSVKKILKYVVVIFMLLLIVFFTLRACLKIFY